MPSEMVDEVTGPPGPTKFLTMVGKSSELLSGPSLLTRLCLYRRALSCRVLTGPINHSDMSGQALSARIAQQSLGLGICRLGPDQNAGCWNGVRGSQAWALGACCQLQDSCTNSPILRQVTRHTVDAPFFRANPALRPLFDFMPLGAQAIAHLALGPKQAPCGRPFLRRDLIQGCGRFGVQWTLRGRRRSALASEELKDGLGWEKWVWVNSEPDRKIGPQVLVLLIYQGSQNGLAYF